MTRDSVGRLRLLHALCFVLSVGFARFPESWKQETTLGRFDWDVCGNTTGWGPWSFGEGFTDGLECPFGNVSIYELFNNAKVHGTIFLMPPINFAINGSWDNLSVGDFWTDSAGYLIVENISVRFWNGSMFELNLSVRPDVVNVFNSHVNYFYYNLSRRINKSWVRNHSVFRGHVVNFTHYSVVDDFLGFAGDGEDVFAVGEGNVGMTNGTHFLKHVSNETALEVLGGVNYGITLDFLPPVIEFSGPTTLVAYGGCVNGTYGFSAEDETAVNLTHDINGSSEEGVEFCTAGLYRAVANAVDSVGRNSSKEVWISVGNATYSILGFHIPPQSLTIPGKQDFFWTAEVRFALGGDVESELNFTLELPGLNTSRHFDSQSGPWTLVENITYSNDSVGFTLAKGACFNYSLDREVEGIMKFRSPEYDPRYGHSVGFNGPELFASQGVLENGSWYVEFNGRGREFSVCVSGGGEPGWRWCGDGICDEDCSACPEDCGPCPGGSSGGWKPREPEPAPVEEGKWEQEGTIAKVGEVKGPVFVVGPGNITLKEPRRLIIGEGLLVSDGERLYAGSVALKEGTYQIIESAPPAEEIIRLESPKPPLLLLLFILFLLI